MDLSEAPPIPKSLAPNPKDPGSSIMEEGRSEDFIQQSDIEKYQGGDKYRKLGVTWQNLTVEGVAHSASFNENALSQFNIPSLIKESRQKPPRFKILHESHGCVKPGEMLLVLGRPGSGCTTLLNMLSNRRSGYESIAGEVKFGTMDYKEAKQYRGQIVMNTEDELFFPTLTVGQTLDFATRVKTPFHLPSGSGSDTRAYQQHMRDFLLKTLGVTHTIDTRVGNEYLRGVSGGERKRVSIMEVLATRGSVFCWDNSTRGLDASTALEFIRAIRAFTDIVGLSTIVTLYQAGNGIYNLFDKVMVLDEGKEVYYGPKDQALPFMENLGFICSDGANIGDFLTGVTVPTERRVREEHWDKFPRTATELLTEYEKSEIKTAMTQEYIYPHSQEASENTQKFKECIEWEKNRGVGKKSPLTASFFTQIMACILRQYQILWGDKSTIIIKQASTLAQALIAGSLFYNAPPDSSGIFIKGGAIFFSLLYSAMMAMTEVTDNFVGRNVIAKHRSFAYFHPAAVCIAQVASDLPILAFQVSQFSLVVYFMVNLNRDAGSFFTFWIILFTLTICVTALFRSIAAASKNFDAASKVSGFNMMIVCMYAGYMISKPQMHPWFVWLFWINPLTYAFEALMSNEFHNKIIACAGSNLTPAGPEYGNDAPKACTGVMGARPGSNFVYGDDYLASLSYNHSHLWRNLGILWAWWALYLFITVVATSNWRTETGGKSALLIPRELASQVSRSNMKSDEESSMPEKRVQGSSSSSSSTSQRKVDKQLVQNTSIFTWKNLCYTVKTPSGDRVLLDNVQGWVKPGMLGALMGSSGAGKTTLLDVLAQRKTEGTINGSILVDGRPVDISFQRSAGYCEQLDVHEPFSTVREALEFSALLRQSRDTPREEKLAYVDTIIDLLELHDLEHTLIGQIGDGLSVEQRKRVTIGVELVSKPSILLFLDEPTSGLDGQSAYNTVRFLRKLADVGQAILVTIHQPSAQLFYQFDNLLLLAEGGKTVYFGEIGEDAQTLKDYFARNGAPCPTHANPAEHMIDVVSGSLSKNKNWAKVWLESPEYRRVIIELDQIISEAASKPPGTVSDGFEFATSMLEQIRLVTQRMNISLYRNIDYVNNKFALHIVSALFNGFSFWMIGNSVADLQLKLFTIFNFIFVAPGVINQLQPLFIDRRNIYEAREKKSKMYSWQAFVTGLIVSEIPYLIICAVLYFVCWYYTVGFPAESSRAGAVFFVMLCYEFLYTGIGQFIAAYAPNAVFASMANPLVIGVLVSFCGVLVPYNQIQAFWRYWMYYLNPFNYLMGSLLTFTIYDAKVECKPYEFARFNTTAPDQTCADYLEPFLNGLGSYANLVNPNATTDCMVCQYSSGSDYVSSLNLLDYYYGWRDAGIVALMVISSYVTVYLLMKLRTKKTKRAEEKK